MVEGWGEWALWFWFWDLCFFWGFDGLVVEWWLGIGVLIAMMDLDVGWQTFL
jgi:hypothetical protein